METHEPTLKEEVAHDKTIRTEEMIGGLVLALAVLGGVLWYLTNHPVPNAPVVPKPATTAQVAAPTNAPDTLSENGKYYTVRAAYPASTPLASLPTKEPNAKAVDAMKQFEVDTISSFKEQGNFDNLSAEDIKMFGFDQGRKETLDITYSTQSGSRTLSYLYTIVEDTFGAHPNTFFRTFTFDAGTGTSLDIKDIFAPGVNYLSILSAQSRKLLPASIAARIGGKVSDVDVSYIKRGTAPNASNFQSWYIAGANLVLVFPPYQVAPYAAGMQTVSIPLAQLSSSLNANFK